MYFIFVWSPKVYIPYPTPNVTFMYSTFLCPRQNLYIFPSSSSNQSLQSSPFSMDYPKLIYPSSSSSHQSFHIFHFPITSAESIYRTIPLPSPSSLQPVLSTCDNPINQLSNYVTHFI